MKLLARRRGIVPAYLGQFHKVHGTQRGQVVLIVGKYHAQSEGETGAGCNEGSRANNGNTRYGPKQS